MVMANVLIDEAVMQALGSLLREFAGGNVKYLPAAMPSAFRALLEAGSGGTVIKPVLAALEAVQNGIYLPGEGIDGFSSVTVNVPSTSVDIGVVVNTVDEDGNWTDITVYGDVPLNAFKDHTHLKNVEIVNATSVGDYAFYGCTGITNITVPDSVIAIGDYAFAEMTSLTTAYIGTTEDSAISSIGLHAFDADDALANIFVYTNEGFVDGSPWGAANATINWMFGVSMVLLDHIESDGSSWIDSDILAQSGLTVTVDAQYLSTANNQALFGAKDTNAANRLSVYYYRNSELYFYFGSSGYPYTRSVDISSRHTYQAVGNTLYVDGAVAVTGNAANFTGTQTIAVFACNYQSGIAEYSTARIYSMRIEKDGELLRDFVPVKYGSVVGLYDKVEQKLYENKGTGAFVAGPAIEE